MSSYIYRQTADQQKWVVLSPRRANRPNVAKEGTMVCPFCPGNEKNDPELYRIGGQGEGNWLIRVIPNKFPFSEIHELIIHSPDHHKNIDELSTSHVRLLIEVYKERYTEHKDKGYISLFHNRGIQAGESLPHAHSQLAVVPSQVEVESPSITDVPEDAIKTKQFSIFSPEVSQWPDEVWIVPVGDVPFEDTTVEALDDLSDILPRVIRLLDHRHGHEFPFNYIFQFNKKWFIRVIPRQKTLGGFELGTGIFVNTQDPNGTNIFLQRHWNDITVVTTEQEMASYHKSV